MLTTPHPQPPPQKLRGVPSKSTDNVTHVNPLVTRRSVTRRKPTVTAREPTVKCLNRRAPNRRKPNSQSLYMIPAPVCTQICGSLWILCLEFSHQCMINTVLFPSSYPWTDPPPSLSLFLLHFSRTGCSKHQNQVIVRRIAGKCVIRHVSKDALKRASLHMNTPALTALVFYVVSKLRCSSVTYTATTLQALYTAMLRVIRGLFNLR